MRVKIIVDSTADMTPAVAEKVGIVPLTVHFGEKEYVSGVDIDNKTFYEMLMASEALPTTSQPTPFAFAEAYKQAVADGSDAVCITCSGRLSGTNQSANIAADDFDGKVRVVDSNTIAISLGILAQYAVELAEQGLSADEIVEKLEQKKGKVRLLALVDTLEYLKKGGRVSPTVAFAGGLLNIKPLIAVEEGEIKVLGKARGTKQGNNLMNQQIEALGGIDASMPVMLGYTGNDTELLCRYREESAQVWASCPELPDSQVGSVVGTHVGPGAVAVAFFSK